MPGKFLRVSKTKQGHEWSGIEKAENLNRRMTLTVPTPAQINRAGRGDYRNAGTLKLKFNPPPLKPTSPSLFLSLPARFEPILPARMLIQRRHCLIAPYRKAHITTLTGLGMATGRPANIILMEQMLID